MGRKIKYDIGKRINDRWIIVAVLKKNKQNKKLLCYDTKDNLFKEGWIFDFTRNIVAKNSSRKPSCILCDKTFDKYNRTELYDINADNAFHQLIKTKNINNRDVIDLRNIREGVCENISRILYKFGDLLARSGQHRRNVGLANVIGSTYEILYRKGDI